MSGRSDFRPLPDSSGLGAIASGMEQDVIALQRPLCAYLEYLPTIARWQAELMLSDVEWGELVGESVAVMKEMPMLVRDAMNKHMPQLIDHQMTRALSALTLERVNTLSGLENMRASTLQFVEEQRTTVIGEIDRQRLATIAQVKNERKASLQEIRAIAHESTDSALAVGKELIDHLFWRLAVLAGAIALFVALFGGVLLTLMRPKQDRG